MNLNRSFCIFIFAILVINAPIKALSQGSGIRFESNLSWAGIVEKAKMEGKYIFMDCYATWCAPCKYMSQNVFTQKPVGDFFNSNFVNVAVQMDQTVKDPESVRAWYKESESINTKYGINAYPNYLIFSSEGELVDRFVGGFEAKEFLDRAAEALNPEKQYVKLINHYKEHLGDSAFLRNALVSSLNSYDQSNASMIAEYYFDLLLDSFSVDNIKLLLSTEASINGKVFQFFLRNAGRLDRIISNNDFWVEERLCFLIYRQQLKPLLNRKDTIFNYKEVLEHYQFAYPVLANSLPIWVNSAFENGIKGSVKSLIDQNNTLEPDWQAIKYDIHKHFSGYDCDQVLDGMKPGYYKNKKMWSQCEKAALDFLSFFGGKLDADDINKIVWDYLFMYSTNPQVLEIALNWSKRSIDMSPTNCDYIDTYANLLYKKGDVKNALQWENKAIEQCGSTKADILSNFKKMKRGERTWDE